MCGHNLDDSLFFLHLVHFLFDFNNTSLVVGTFLLDSAGNFVAQADTNINTIKRLIEFIITTIADTV